MRRPDRGKKKWRQDDILYYPHSVYKLGESKGIEHKRLRYLVEKLVQEKTPDEIIADGVITDAEFIGKVEKLMKEYWSNK